MVTREEVTDEMTNSRERKRNRSNERPRAELSERTGQLSTAVRLVMMIWEIIWTLVREHMLRGTGPRRLL